MDKGLIVTVSSKQVFLSHDHILSIKDWTTGIKSEAEYDWSVCVIDSWII